jgi:peptide-methionine (R)-S-oxide reductase
MMNRRTLALAGLTVAALGAFLRSARGRAEGSAGSTFEISKSEEEWRKQLTSEQYYVLRKHGTERAGSSPLDKQYVAGSYLCAGCDLALFSSKAKFNSGTGWPSFYAPLENAVATSVDKSLFTTRTEVHCRRCGGHLGHVFDDGLGTNFVSARQLRCSSPIERPPRTDSLKTASATQLRALRTEK